MKFTNTVEDLITLEEFRYFKLIPAIILLGVINLPPCLGFIYYFFKTSIIPYYQDNDIPILIISIVLLIMFIVCDIYIVFVILPKMIRKDLKKKCIKRSKEDIDFKSEKEIFVEENLIKIISKNKESQIIINKNTKLIRYQKCILIADVITKKLPIQVHPLIIPVERLNPEDIKFMNELKIEILNFK